MTAWQARHIYGHPRDDKGNLTNPNQKDPPSYEEIFRRVWAERGLRPEQIDARWKLYMHEQKLRTEWEKKLSAEQVDTAWCDWLKAHPRAHEGVW